MTETVRLLQIAESDVEFHQNTLSIIWTIVINIGVLVAIFRYNKFSFWIHALIAWVVIGLTLAALLILIVPLGFEVQPLSEVELIEDIHNVVGFVLLFWLALQVILGITARKIQEPASVNTSTVILMKRIHKIFSYGILLIAMFNCLNRRYQDQDYAIFGIILAGQVICIAIYIYLKFFYSTLSQKIVDSQAQSAGIEQITSQQKIHQSVEYVIFADYVYDIEPLRGLHPGGQQVIEMVKGREIDRFLYGMYAAQYSTGVSPYQHSSRCLHLVGEPISKISRIPLLSGLQTLNECSVVSKEKISFDSTTYLVRLKPYSEKPLKYMGYSSASQFGQYFSLSLDGKVTRLYTTVFCMRKQNQLFMEQYFPGSTKTLSPQSAKIGNGQIIQMTEYQMNSELKTARYQNSAQIVPLLIKKYQKGKVTPLLLNKDNDLDRKVVLSCGKGAGMKFDIQSSGKIIIVAGGTGIFPFIDFIDILFKSVLVSESHASTKNLVQNDSILSQKVFQDKEIILWAAINSPYDIPSHTLYQINYLSQLKSNKGINFKCQFKVKNNGDLMKRHFGNIPLTSQRFNESILAQMQKDVIVYVCGPPEMNSSLVNLFLENGVDKKKYLLL